MTKTDSTQAAGESSTRSVPVLALCQSRHSRGRDAPGPAVSISHEAMAAASATRWGSERATCSHGLAESGTVERESDRARWKQSSGGEVRVEGLSEAERDWSDCNSAGRGGVGEWDGAPCVCVQERLT